MGIEHGSRKIIKHDFVQGQITPPPRVKDLQLPRLGKPRRGLLIFDTRSNWSIDSNNLLRFRSYGQG